MFEKFGILDVLSLIRKKIASIFLLTLCLVIFFGFINIGKLKNSSLSVSLNPEKMSVSIASFYVQPVIDENISDKIDSSFYKSLPDNYVAILNTDYCLEYLYDKISSKYSKEDILKYANISTEGSLSDVKNLNFQNISDVYVCKRQSNTMVVNVAAKSYNKDFSRDIVEFLEEFLLKSADSKIKNSNIEYIGRSEKVLDFSNLSQKDENLFLDSSGKQSSSFSQSSAFRSTLISTIKYVILPTVVILFLLISCLILYALFNPTLNRKSDFSPYGIPVIGEIFEDVEREEKK